MFTVILAEKPSVAADYAKALGLASRQEGYFQLRPSFLGEEVYVTFAIGHLVELEEPGFYQEAWKNWSLSQLPMFPTEFSYRVISDKKDQYQTVTRLLKQADTIIIATDAGREGENIAWSILHTAEIDTTSKNVLRLWIGSTEKDAILEGFNNLKDDADYYPMYEEAHTRQLADWLLGMNGSVLYSLILQEKGIHEVFSLGRVQTPTLFLIYRRQQAITEFKKQVYYAIQAKLENEAGVFQLSLADAPKFESFAEGQQFFHAKELSVGKKFGRITAVQRSKKESDSPALFSLNSLQKQANTAFKASAQQTLEAVQGLYDKKLVTYPRSDTSVITEDEFSYLKEHFSAYSKFLGISAPLVTDLPRKKYVNRAKVVEHHAIIPTKSVPTKEAFDQLTPLQQSLYQLIVKTTTAMFLGGYVYDETVVTLQVGQLLFKLTGKTPLEQGWRLLFPLSKKEEEQPALPPFQVGDEVDCQLSLLEKETQPPRLLTEAQLLEAMISAGKTLENESYSKILAESEGIGTVATRAAIIEGLKDRGYIESVNNKLLLTEKGSVFCRAVESEALLSSAEMTAKWETYLRKIGQQQGDPNRFLSSIQSFIRHLIETVPGQLTNLDVQTYLELQQAEQAKKTVGQCPLCHSDVQDKGTFYGCLGYPSCEFTLPKVFLEKKLSKKVIQELLKNGKTAELKGFVSAKTGKSFSAVLVLTKDNLSFVFPPKKGKKRRR